MRSVILLLIGLALDGLIGPAQTARAHAPDHCGTVMTIVGAVWFDDSGDGALDFGDGREFSSLPIN
jgi:hypothetical protein